MTTDHAEDSEHASPMEPVPMEPVPPPERRTRAGRNLTAAIAVGLGLGAVVLISLYVWKAAFLGVIALAVLLGLWELSNALRADRVRVAVVPIAVGGLAILVAAYAGGSEPMMVALALTVLATMVWRLPENPAGYVRDVTSGIFVTLYVPFLAGFAALMLRDDDGAPTPVPEILDAVGLRARANALPGELSGGERARAGLAVALANDPDILLCDEPTGELDGAAAERVLVLLRQRAAAGAAVVVVTHSERVARDADRVLALRDGEAQE